MNKFITADGKYTVISHGNGWAYEVICQETGESMWVQDDDACQLQAETDNFTDTAAIDYHMEALA